VLIALGKDIWGLITPHLRVKANIEKLDQYVNDDEYLEAMSVKRNR
jgi:hypothetical protein